MIEIKMEIEHEIADIMFKELYYNFHHSFQEMFHLETGFSSSSALFFLSFIENISVYIFFSPS